MSASAKFLFDTDFGSGAPRGAASASAHLQALADAEANGYRRGLADGQRQAQQEAERRSAAAMERAAAGLAQLVAGLTSLAGTLEQNAAEVAIATGTKLASALIAREPAAEVTALVSECLRHLVGTPHVVVRVAESTFDGLGAKLQELAASCGFDGRLIVMAEPGLAEGDCKVEWADGGTVRSRATIEAAIDEAVARYLAAPNAQHSEQ